MIFVFVGTHNQQFNRLIREIDGLAGQKIKERIFVQTGNSTFKPKNCGSVRFMEYKDYIKKIREASLIVCHGGSGAVIDSLNEGKPLVIVPRLKKFGEHTNDHQTDLAFAMQKKGRAVAVIEIRDLFNAIKKARSIKPVRQKNLRPAKEIKKFLGGIK